MGEEKSVLRWGGIAGLLAGIIFIVGAVIVFGFVPPAPADPEGPVMRAPDVRAVFSVTNSLFLGAIILVVFLFLALYRALRETSLAPALFGSVLGILGLVVLAAAALPVIATNPISDLYHAPGATPEDQATLVLLWQATLGIFAALQAAGSFLLAIGFIVLGVAMLGARGFGKGFGGVSVVLGVVGVVGASLFFIVDPALALFGLLALIIFPPLFGWKVYSLSRSV